ncbi:MAG: hypothetical protein AB1801_09465 [Chloroflexota bacterium]
MYDPALSTLISAAVLRLQSELAQAAPLMAQPVEDWIRQLSAPREPGDYFKHPLAFPALLLPWWLEQTLADAPDPALQADLIYSTINGYYYIRLIDNLMDGQATVELKLLPALGFFHTQFQLAYQRYFEAGHPFWNLFQAVWFQSAEAAWHDAALLEIDEVQFEQIAAQKVCAAKIPLAAVCYRRSRVDLIEPWSNFVDRLGCWHQMLNDLLGWHRDFSRGAVTYFLSEAGRRRSPDEPLAGWVAGEGYSWALSKLDTWMSALQQATLELGSPDLVNYLETRQAMLLRQQIEVSAGLRHLARLVTVAGSMPT